MILSLALTLHSTWNPTQKHRSKMEMRLRSFLQFQADRGFLSNESKYADNDLSCVGVPVCCKVQLCALVFYPPFRLLVDSCAKFLGFIRDR